MPHQSDRNTRENSIQSALQHLKSIPSGSKTPSIREVARKFGLSEATLRRAIRNGGPSNKPGNSKILTNHEEEQLVGYCLNMQKLGFGLTKQGVNQCVLDIMKQNGRTHPFTEGGPGQAWWERFMKDHTELSFRVPQALSEARAQRGNPIIIKDHFAKLDKILKEHSLNGNCIWNMDETGFVISPELQKVIAKKGARQIHQVAHGNSHEHISVCPTISAAGTYIPPLLIYKGKRMIPGLLDGSPPGSVMGFTDTGYMREDLFQMYINHFVHSVPPARPVLLIVDGHKSHISYTSINFLHNNGILLYALPPHTTHILQPAELPFAQLKKAYNSGCNKLRTDNNGEIVTKYSFARVFGEAFIKTYTPTAICNAFRTTGIWPFNPDAINPNRLDPSLLTERFEIPPPSPHLAQSLSESLTQHNPETTPNPNLHHMQTRTKTTEEFALLKKEVESLKKKLDELNAENIKLKRDLAMANEELIVYKTPGTCSLRTALMYPLSRSKPFEEQENDVSGSAKNQTQSQVPKKRKTMPFAQLLTNEESLQALRDSEEEVARKAEEVRKRKDENARRRVVRELEKERKREEIKRKNEERVRRKKAEECAKKEVGRVNNNERSKRMSRKQCVQCVSKNKIENKENTLPM